MAVAYGLYPTALAVVEGIPRNTTNNPVSGLAGVKSTGSAPVFSPEKLRERLGDVLRRDAHGAVYSLKGCPYLAVKEIRLDGLDQHSVDAIRRRLIALLGTFHPDVLKYHQVVTDGNTILVVTDRCCGDLRQFITDYRDIHEPVPNELMLSFLGQLADALAYLHGLSGDMHGDPLPCAILEPSNVLFEDNGRRAVLGGFELCKGTSSGTAKAGDPAYIAPETLLRGDVTPASAVWSLGAVAYELATLRKPDFLRGKEPAEVFVDGWRPDLSGVADDLARSILERILVLDPERRPTARELARLFRMTGISPDERKAQDTRLKELREAFGAALDRANDETVALRKDPTDGAAKVNSIRGHYAAAAKLFEQMQEIKAETGETKESEESEEPEKKQLIEENDSTDLMRAVDRNDVEAVKALTPLQGGTKMKGCALVGDWKIYEGTALMRAAAYGYTEIVELLAEKEKGLRDSDGWTALMFAAAHGHTDCLMLLLEKEGGMKSNSGRTALMAAAHSGHIDCVKLLLKKEGGVRDNSGQTALVAAADCGRTDCLKLLLEKEGGIQCNNGWTALMSAAFTGHADCVRLLLEKECGMQCESGRTALMWAAHGGHADCVKLLMERESGMKKRDGWTALMIAVQNNKTDCVRFLLGEKDLKGNNGETALGLAMIWRRYEIVDLLSK